MLKSGLITRCISVGIIAVFLLGGCSSILDYGVSVVDNIFGDEEEKTPTEIMAEGRESLQKGNYEAATDAFEMIKDRYPYSKYAIEAELKLADSLFEREQFNEAYEAYDDFERLHPKNKNIPYVIYQKGMCYFQQITSVDRDQTDTLKAKEDFDRLIKRFPGNEYAHRARKHLRKCLIYLSEYELYVAHYYYKGGNYRAAMERYAYIIKNYPDMGQYHEAMEYISKCKEKISEEGEGETTSFWQRLNPFR